jgi:hypothetical protein
MRKVHYLQFLSVTLVMLLMNVASVNAQTVKKTVELPEFKAIYVNSGYTVNLKQSNKQEVIVETLPEIWELTSIKVEDGILMINMERKPESPNKSIWAKIDDIKLKTPMKITVSVKNINELQVNGNGKIITVNSLASDLLKLSLAGNGEMDLDIKSSQVKTDVTGSGSILLKGYASSNEVFIAGSGSLKAFLCELETSKVRVSGSGSCELNVTQTLESLVAGNGTVKHKGNTKNVTKKVYGSGAVERAF